MKIENNSFKMGLRDGIPVAFGYIAVSFAFGLLASAEGLTAAEAVFISLFNMTSAGQIAAVPILASGGSFIELALTQVVINARYALMSISLSQRLGKSVRFIDRFAIGFANTDEIFAVECGKETALGRNYLYGLIIPPYIGWFIGTLLGSVAGNILPELLRTALSVALYAMFISILIPAARSSLKAGLCIAVSAAVSCIFYFVPVLSANIQPGFVIVICTLAVCSLFALLLPIEDEEEDEE